MPPGAERCDGRPESFSLAKICTLVSTLRQKPPQIRMLQQEYVLAKVAREG